MPKKSFVNAAYDVLSARYERDNLSVPMPFGELLIAVGQDLGIEDEDELLKIASRFYTDLTLDGRFVIKGENTWVLREHEKFENVHIDMNEIYAIDETSEDEIKQGDEESENEEEISDSFHDDEEEEELGEESEENTNADAEYEENN